MASHARSSVVIRKVQETYLDIFNNTLKLKETKLVKTDILFSYKLGLISIRGRSFTETATVCQEILSFVQNIDRNHKKRLLQFVILSRIII